MNNVVSTINTNETNRLRRQAGEGPEPNLFERDHRRQAINIPGETTTSPQQHACRFPSAHIHQNAQW